MSGEPRVVLGMPAYNRPDTLARTLESLFSQTYLDFALVIVDDRGSAECAAIVEAYRRDHRQLHYASNERRLGMVGNWRRVFERSRELYPTSPYFAWVSDHDLWHARWLESLVAVLDDQPEVVLAYTGKFRMLPGRGEIKLKTFDTLGLTGRGARMRASAMHMPAGDVIYGLMRADALQAAGVFRAVLTPDRQVLLALSLFGQVKQIRDVLWYREILRDFDLGRQRAVFFPDGAPLYIYTPSHLQHFTTLLWDFAVLGKGRPAFGRVSGAWFAVLQLGSSCLRQLSAPLRALQLVLGTRGTRSQAPQS